MVEPTVVPRSEHSISRRQIDPDALRVLYRLKEANHVACLVGGSVRDLLLGRRPKDFDIGTSAHPYQVKRLFRNCWIIGRRFRLAHVKFGQKIIEVATFRRQVPAPVAESAPEGDAKDAATGPARDQSGQHDFLIHRDNTFGTPEEDAFRRDVTINALFYDIATFSIIDYVGGLADLRAGVVRAIGDPDVRFREDPVRMLRAIALASRLGFTVDPPTDEAIRRHRLEIGRSAPARLLEEYYKILRTGASESAFRRLIEVGLIEPISPELHSDTGASLWDSLAALDRYRRRFDSTPDTLTNPILLGSLLVPLGFSADPWPPSRNEEPPDGARPGLGVLPLARRDRERLRQILILQRRLRATSPSPRIVRGVVGRGAFPEALTWMEIHGRDPLSVERWKTLADPSRAEAQTVLAPGFPERRRRRRRRSRRRPQPQ
jgi:poly(A) polymerase